MEIKTIKIYNDNFQSAAKLFENKDFFFKTKRPESLFEGNIKALVLNNNEAFLIYCDNKLEGLISTEDDEIDKNSIFINLRLRNMNIILDNLASFNSLLLDVSKEYEIIKMKIFDFDEIGEKVCQKLQFNIEAILKEHIYKNNKYNNLIIYSKNIDRW